MLSFIVGFHGSFILSFSCHPPHASNERMNEARSHSFSLYSIPFVDDLLLLLAIFVCVPVYLVFFVCRFSLLSVALLPNSHCFLFVRFALPWNSDLVGKKGKSKQKRGVPGSPASPAPPSLDGEGRADSPAAGSAAAARAVSPAVGGVAAKKAPLTHSYDVLKRFELLGIDAPLHIADVPGTLKALEEKRQWLAAMMLTKKGYQEQQQRSSSSSSSSAGQSVCIQMDGWMLGRREKKERAKMFLSQREGETSELSI